MIYFDNPGIALYKYFNWAFQINTQLAKFIQETSLEKKASYTRALNKGFDHIFCVKSKTKYYCRYTFESFDDLALWNSWLTHSDLSKRLTKKSEEYLLYLLDSADENMNISPESSAKVAEKFASPIRGNARALPRLMTNDIVIIKDNSMFINPEYFKKVTYDVSSLVQKLEGEINKKLSEGFSPDILKEIGSICESGLNVIEDMLGAELPKNPVKVDTIPFYFE